MQNPDKPVEGLWLGSGLKAEGVWVTYYHDFSGGVRVFESEIDALRDAYANHKDCCRFLKWGEDIRNA